MGLLRDACAAALRNSEDFDQLLFVFEKMGCDYTGRVGTLGNEYRGTLNAISKKSPLSQEIAKLHRSHHTPFPILYEKMFQGRNDLMHQGVAARNLTKSAVEVAIILQDALMQNADVVGDFMIGNPIRAETWQPVSFVRQQMLTNSFSYLPVLFYGKWFLLSDTTVARYLRVTSQERRRRMSEKLYDAIGELEDNIRLDEAQLCSSNTPIEEVLTEFKGKPILVCRDDNLKDLVGILTAFDLL